MVINEPTRKRVPKTVFVDRGITFKITDKLLDKLSTEDDLTAGQFAQLLQLGAYRAGKSITVADVLAMYSENDLFELKKVIKAEYMSQFIKQKDSNK